MQTEKSIPISDIAYCYTNENGYITLELKDVTHQFDNKVNASYAEILKNISRKEEKLCQKKQKQSTQPIVIMK